MQEADEMITVNALKLRNNLGDILDRIDRDKEPVIITKGRKVRAVMITPEQFKARFLDLQAEEERTALLKAISDMRAGTTGDKSSLDILRELRGYGE